MLVGILGMWLAVGAAWADGLEAAAARLDEVLSSTSAWRAMRQADRPPSLPEKDWEAVRAGDTAVTVVAVDGTLARKTLGVRIVAVPIDRLWGAINDERQHVKYTDLVYAELLEGAACQDGRQVFQYLDVGVPMVQDRWWVTIRRSNRAVASASGGKVRELVWSSAPDGSGVTSAAAVAKMAEGVPVGFTRGSWYLTAIDAQHTLVEYYSWVDPGGNLNPKMMAWFAGRSLRKAIDGMVAASAAPDLACRSI
jgi:hypothetical protein